MHGSPSHMQTLMPFMSGGSLAEMVNSGLELILKGLRLFHRIKKTYCSTEQSREGQKLPQTLGGLGHGALTAPSTSLSHM